MSDDEEYEYEYDDDEMEDADQVGDDDDEMDYDDEDNFEYTTEEEEADDAEVALENAYYNSKGLRETDLDEAASSFEQVILQEQEELKKDENNTKIYGSWSYKAIKQLVKLHLRSGNTKEMLKQYDRLLDCIAQGDVSPNAIEKGINGMLERVSSLYQGYGNVMPQGKSLSDNSDNDGENDERMEPQKMALAVYDATLRVFHPLSGVCPNERLWFKTNLKYGQLLYEMNETPKLQQVLKDLKNVQKGPANDSASGSGGMKMGSPHHHMGSSSGGAGAGGTSQTQSMEIYALQMQLYSRQKDNKKLREVFNKAMAVRGGIPHPRTLALIQELGGKMHMGAREYESAGKTFFQAFKSYDEAGDPSRLRCLKYLVLASMLHASSINPFDSQEARPYRDDPEILAMTNLVQAFHNNEIQTFERILRQNQGRIMEDEFVREHVEDLLRTIRTQVLRRLIRPYTRITLKAIAKELNDIPVPDVESLLVGLILDGSLMGHIDQVNGVLLKHKENKTHLPPPNQLAGAAARKTSSGSAPGSSSSAGAGRSSGSASRQAIQASPSIASSSAQISSAYSGIGGVGSSGTGAFIGGSGTGINTSGPLQMGGGVGVGSGGSGLTSASVVARTVAATTEAALRSSRGGISIHSSEALQSSVLIQKCHAIDSLIKTLDELSATVTNTRTKEGPPQMRGVSIH